jgi:hypothetical protein
LQKNPQYYGVDPAVSVDSWLRKVVSDSLHDLAESGCLTIESHTVKPLFPGRVASHYYIRHSTIRDFLENIGSVDSGEAAIYTVAMANEYREAPLRHNEDVEVRDFSKTFLPAAFSTTHDFSDPRTKVHVLFRAWMARVRLPYVDFEVDQALALEQAIRIAQALVELAVVHGRTDTVLSVVRAMQCLKQACVFGADPLAVYFDPEQVRFLQSQCAVTTLAHLRDTKIFADLITLPRVDIKSGRYEDMHAAHSRLKQGTGGVWYVVEGDGEGRLKSFTRLTATYRAPKSYCRLHVVSDCWYGLDQEYQCHE